MKKIGYFLFVLPIGVLIILFVLLFFHGLYQLFAIIFIYGYSDGRCIDGIACSVTGGILTWLSGGFVLLICEGGEK